jgi:hypothetical protein
MEEHPRTSFLCLSPIGAEWYLSPAAAAALKLGRLAGGRLMRCWSIRFRVLVYDYLAKGIDLVMTEAKIPIEDVSDCSLCHVHDLTAPISCISALTARLRRSAKIEGF